MAIVTDKLKIIIDRSNYVEEALSIIDKEFDVELRSAAQYALSTGGKRLRPILCMLSCELVGGDYKETIPAFTALELIHNATLIHDDILDDDVIRRGNLSVPKKYGLKTAVLTGDALLSLGLRYASITENTKIVKLLSETSLKMVSGIKKQLNLNKKAVSEDVILEINYLKSGSLFEAATELGAIIGGADEDTVKLLAYFGQLFGNSYQIKDDIIDIQTKSYDEPRNDLLNGDFTLPIIYALESNIPSEMKKKLFEDFNSLTIQNILDILSKTSSIQKCWDKIDYYLSDAQKILDQFNDSEAKNGILFLLTQLKSKNL